MPSLGKASCDGVVLPNQGCMLGVLVFPNPLNSDMDYWIFKVRTGVNACDCARGCADIVRVRESALKVDSGRKIPCRTGEFNQHRRRVRPMLYQLSYISTPTYHSIIITYQLVSINSKSLRYYNLPTRAAGRSFWTCIGRNKTFLPSVSLPVMD